MSGADPGADVDVEAVSLPDVHAPIVGDTRLVRRQRITVVIALVCAVVSIGGLVASRFVRSPQQQAASMAAPTPSVLTAPVVRQVLNQTLTTRGTVAAAREVQVAPAAAGGQGASVAVVTAVRVGVGQAVSAGQVLVEVSGRPVIALPGDVPAYRDLKPGDTGKDITELQQALAARGLYHKSASGTFDQATKDAVRTLYQQLGYDVPTTGGPGDAGDRHALQAAQDAVAQAQRAVDDLRRQMAVPGAASGQGQEPLPVQLGYLQAALGQAVQAQQELVATTGPELPVAEFVFVPTFPARVETLTAVVGQPVSGPLLTLSGGQLNVVAQLRPDQASLVRQGAVVTLTAEALGMSVAGTLTTVGQVTTAPPAGSVPPQAGAAGQSAATPVAPYVPIAITPAAPLATAWDGQDVRLTFTQARTAGPVLTVPLSAVSTEADGSTTVTRSTGGTTTRIAVRAGVSANGMVEVTPMDGAPLAAGDRVVVGQ